jgi:predicted aspartyl protease
VLLSFIGAVPNQTGKGSAPMTSTQRPVARRTWLLALLAIPLLVAPIGCQRGARQVVTAGGIVTLFVQQGPDGSTLAFAPVYINGEGPFAFALDTGASHSVIDEQLAEQLNLPTIGNDIEITGVVGTAEARQVQVGSWRVGQVELPGHRMVAVSLSEPNRRQKIRGLLGSDALSRFGTVTVDYRTQRLLLHDSH